MLMERADFADLAALAAHRQRRWERQRDYVLGESPLHRRAWAGKAPPPRLEALADLPLIDKEMLRASQRAHPPFGDYLAAPADAVARVHRTSGTTGTAMNLALSAPRCARDRGGRWARAIGGRPRARPPRRALPELPAVDGRLHRPHHAGGDRRDGGAVRCRRNAASGAAPSANSASPRSPARRPTRRCWSACWPSIFPGCARAISGCGSACSAARRGWTTRHFGAGWRPPGACRRATPITASPTCSATLPARPSTTTTCISWRSTCCTRNWSPRRAAPCCRGARASAASWC